MTQVSASNPAVATINGQVSSTPVELMPPNSVSSQNGSILDYPTVEPPVSTVAATIDTRPTQEPPSQLTVQEKAISAGWQKDKKVLGLWSVCSNQRTGYMYVDGMGWRKFADNSDSAIIAFNIIASHAKVTGKSANFYESEDGKINTLYVW
ncbi:secreted metalloprotease [Richelia sinica FACHB-800]|uniref:Secreted metalloprotease n=1 Tax=Richelia sinica FACHB-800 TaxID=1357546 RepID=A0A975T385_9NOST|nr:hypothetical protein [Richelia sinica]MBD2665314.1 hypothetical protein [Richelia sinica FACHB-800]QXE21411.1 secreted metalloprotease [Richelia sinica FACHB-800]